MPALSHGDGSWRQGRRSLVGRDGWRGQRRSGNLSRVTGATRARRNAMDRLRPIRRALRGVEAAQVRRFGRSALSTLFRTPVLVLETTGRRSGRQRQTALAFHRRPDGDLVIVGGAGGQRRTPDWVANVRSHPDVHVIAPVRVGAGERSVPRRPPFVRFVPRPVPPPTGRRRAAQHRGRSVAAASSGPGGFSR
ncbi:MAG TPA: hypothetical protein DCS55_08965 [Acidimicrobiaceae bacterium]|nr:hypothetical protein [Acidimicrobiaceae bacterium]